MTQYYEIENDEVVIIKDEAWDKVGMATYREDYYTGGKWSNSKNKAYLHSSRLKQYLHRYIMGKCYGPDVLATMTKEGFVIDHMNNNGFDCRVCNLEFLHKRDNTAKGNNLDPEISTFRETIAISIFKDFTTNHYQLILGFDALVGEYQDGYMYPMQSMKLLYDTDYRLVLLNLERGYEQVHSLTNKLDCPLTSILRLIQNHQKLTMTFIRE